MGASSKWRITLLDPKSDDVDIIPVHRFSIDPKHSLTEFSSPILIAIPNSVQNSAM
jgi:hypothetical protein